MTRGIRKIAVIGGFAVGAALGLAPLASADPVTSAFDNEVASLNSIFQFDAALAGVPSSDYSVGAQGLDFILPADVPTVQDSGTTAFDYLLYGVNPVQAGLAGDPGAATLFNGALINFDDAYNTGLYALLNNGALISGADLNDLFGTSASITEALAGGTASSAVTDFLTDGYNDLLGFFSI